MCCLDVVYPTHSLPCLPMRLLVSVQLLRCKLISTASWWWRSAQLVVLSCSCKLKENNWPYRVPFWFWPLRLLLLLLLSLLFQPEDKTKWYRWRRRRRRRPSVQPLPTKWRHLWPVTSPMLLPRLHLLLLLLLLLLLAAPPSCQLPVASRPRTLFVAVVVVYEFIFWSLLSLRCHMAKYSTSGRGRALDGGEADVSGVRQAPELLSLLCACVWVCVCKHVLPV